MLHAFYSVSLIYIIGYVNVIGKSIFFLDPFCMASSKLIRLVLRLLRYLISLAGGSIKGLLALIGWTHLRLVRKRDKPFHDYFLAPSDNADPESSSNQHASCPSVVPGAEHEILDFQCGAKPSKAPDDPSSHPPPVYSGGEYVCPSFAPRAEQVVLDIPLHDRGNDNDGPSTTIIHPPSPTRTSLSGQGSLYAGSRSYRAVAIEESSGPDARSVNSRSSRRSVGRQTNAVGTSVIPVLPISTHDLHMVTGGPGTSISQRSASPMPSRPTSGNSKTSALPAKPIKISSPIPPPRQLTPPPITTPTIGAPSRSSSPENGLTILPMSTHTVQRWNRGIEA